MQNNEGNQNENFFEKFGLEVNAGKVEEGETYPIYGMITKFIDDTPGNVIVEINYSIRAKLFVPDAKRVEVLKERAFEPGIFVSTIKQSKPSIEVSCTTVIFGKRQGADA